MNPSSRARIPRETKFLAEPIGQVAEDGVFEGYASLFGIADLGRDIVAPGAFAASIAKRGAAGVKMLWQHDPAEPIGRWLGLAEDGRGLRVRGKLNLAVARAREIHALMREGAIDGLSIGFRVERARPDRASGARRLEKLDLWEISLVTFPMLPGARVSAVKRASLSPPRERVVGGADRERGRGLGPAPHALLSPSPDPAPRGHPPPRRGEGSLPTLIRRAARRLFASP